MSTRMTVAFWCYLLGTLTLTAFGIAYLVSPTEELGKAVAGAL